MFLNRVKSTIIFILFPLILNATWNLNIKSSKASISNENNSTLLLTTKLTLEQNKEAQQKYFESIWKQIKDELIESSELYGEKDKVPNSSFWKTDKKDLNTDIDTLLNDIINTLLNDDILQYKEKVEIINQEIKNNEKKLSLYREEKIGAPKESMIYTTKDNYDKKIKNLTDENILKKNNIRIIKNRLKDSFQIIGVNLNTEQINTLLVRADGYNIIQVALVMNVIKQITDQLLILMKKSDENLVQTKRYYGMHLMTLALVVHIQQRYLDAVDSIYFIKLKKILINNNKIINDTKELIVRESDEERKIKYHRNLEAQKFILEVTNLYKKQLSISRSQMKKAQDETKKNILLLENTYRTVKLSASLYKLISQNRLVFDKINQIQMPDIIPFKNIQMKKQYKKLQQEILSE